jgi:hypothetical protein
MLRSFLPQSVAPLTASRGLSRFVRAALGRHFADVVRSLQSTPPSFWSPIHHSTFAVDSFFDIQPLIAANSSPSVRLLPSRCDGPKPTPPRRPRVDAMHCRPAAPCGSVLTSSAAGGLLPRPPRPATRRGDTSRRIRGARASCRLMECRAWAVGGAHWAEQDRRGKALRGVRSGRSVLAMMILEGMNCLDV